MKKILFVLLMLCMSLMTYAKDYYGAIAINKETGAYGYSYDYSYQSNAENAALVECRKRGGTCEIATWVRNGCAAVAYSPKTKKYGWAWAGTGRLNQVARDAKSSCNQSDCVVKANFCTSYEYWY